MVDYEIKYTNRKTLAIYITKDARVEVRCNKRVRKADIERFICEKEKWINEKLELMRNRKSVLIGNGSKILYLGKEYEIVVSESKEGMYDDKFFVNPSSDERYVYIVLEKFYKEKAKEIIAERLHKYYGLIFNQIRYNVRKYKVGFVQRKEQYQLHLETCYGGY